jgi:hypothetical protein
MLSKLIKLGWRNVLQFKSKVKWMSVASGGSQNYPSTLLDLFNQSRVAV